MPLFLDVATMICFAFASGMVFVLHVVEQPAYALATGPTLPARAGGEAAVGLSLIPQADGGATT